MSKFFEIWKCFSQNHKYYLQSPNYLKIPNWVAMDYINLK